jgi:uncharacterized LabA/DUF88 family protein
MPLAVLIDADNISAAIADRLFSRIGQIDKIGLRRAYGDFNDARLAPWNDAAKRFRICRRLVPCKVKNATDWALGLDAMHLLDGRTFKGFCIVSSDGDFARLAKHLRENGAAVYCLGEKKAPQSLRAACTKFIELKPPA